jgi:mxaD protein
MSKFFTAMLVSLFAFTNQASAAIDETIRLKETIEINAPADKVWEKIGSFADMSWHPAIAKTEITSGKADEVGATRLLTTQEGGKIHEVLTGFDAEAKSIKLEITESALPVREFGATLKVKESADGKATVVWSANFKRKDPANPGAAGQDDAAAKAAILGIFKSGLENIKKISE